MEKLLIVAVMALFFIMAVIPVVVLADDAEQLDRTDVHIIVGAEEDGTEIGIKVDDREPYTKIVDKGTNFLPTYTLEDRPRVRILAYGDEMHPDMVKAHGEWYMFVVVKPPKDGDSE